MHSIVNNERDSNGAYPLNVEFKALTFEVHSAFGATALNLKQLCGKTDWAVITRVSTSEITFSSAERDKGYYERAAKVGTVGGIY